MYHRIPILAFFVFFHSGDSFAEKSRAGLVRVNKCCEPNEILVDLRCTDINEINQTNSGTYLKKKLRPQVITVLENWVKRVMFVCLFLQMHGRPYSLAMMAKQIYKCMDSILRLESRIAIKSKCGPFIIIQR